LNLKRWTNSYNSKIILPVILKTELEEKGLPHHKMPTYPPLPSEPAIITSTPQFPLHFSRSRNHDLSLGTTIYSSINLKTITPKKKRYPTARKAKRAKIHGCPQNKL
jgi:hypothetical protein